MEPAIEVASMSKCYRLYGNPWDRLKEKLPWDHEQRYREVHALRDLSFEVPAGSCVGVVGANGAGKSTLLKILTGTTYPTSGSYTIRGRVASLLELGAGFNQEFSGRENIFMNAALMGLGRKEAQKKFHEILEFSELEDFIHAPIRTYSSGMICRLGFSVAVAVDPDVLILDEILAVGDMHFRRKCVNRIMDYRNRGKTMFFCSHSLYDVRQICDRAIWMKDGKLELYDSSIVVTNDYATFQNARDFDEASAEPWSEDSGRPKPAPIEADDHARILSAELIDPRTRELRNQFAPREDVAVRIHLKNGKSYEPLHLAVGFTRSDGTLCLAMTTEFDGVLIEANEAIVTLLLPKIGLLSGKFVVPIWLLDAQGVHRFHELPCKQNLIILNRDKELGLFLADRSWEVDVVEPGPWLDGILSHSEPRAALRSEPPGELPRRYGVALTRRSTTSSRLRPPPSIKWIEWPLKAPVKVSSLGSPFSWVCSSEMVRSAEPPSCCRFQVPRTRAVLPLVSVRPSNVRSGWRVNSVLRSDSIIVSSLPPISICVAFGMRANTRRSCTRISSTSTR